MDRIFGSLLRRLPGVRQMLEMRDDIRQLKEMASQSSHLAYLSERHVLVAEYLKKNLYDDPKYKDSLRLNRHEFQVYSESGEDGILHEIFKRIGRTNDFFIEFGVGDGICNSTTYLLLKGWRALWIECDEKRLKVLRGKFRQLIDRGQLQVRQARITPQNIEALFLEAGIPLEPDLLSICIDGNDYWIWKAIERYRPRVFMIEYNALFPPGDDYVMTYNPDHAWNGTSYFGASLRSLQRLGDEKGYCLVGCNYSGVRAFFVRQDLAGEHFLAPFTSENHYEPPRYFLNIQKGHERDFGSFEIPSDSARPGFDRASRASLIPDQAVAPITNGYGPG